MRDPPNGADRTTTAYDRDALRDAYGQYEEGRETFAVPRERYGRIRQEQREDALGGARVLVHRGTEALLVSNRGEYGWDVPGGAREPGEAPETTARREVREELSLAVELTDLLLVTEFGFVPESGVGDRIWGLWPVFEGVPVGDGDDYAVQVSELDGARWFEDPPDELDEVAEPLVRAFLAG